MMTRINNGISIQQANWVTDQHQLTAVRTVVFIQEQKVAAELEMDGNDLHCQHVKAVNEKGEIIGTARLLPNHYIGRMCVLKSHRNMGIGGKMLCYFIDYARTNNFQSLMLNSQLTARSFYQKYGFVADSDVFIEADIEHIHMTLSIANC